jgi:nitrite reductase/ring-hydroxylating ferredoxin subunit
MPNAENFGSMLTTDTGSGAMSMQWVDAGARSALQAGGMKEVAAGEAALLLYDLAGTVFATDAVCPHHAAWLSEGSIEGDLINCPRHQGQFHIPTGAWRRGPTCPDLKIYPVRVEDGRIYVGMPE